jgi:hypothetical protein
MLVDIGLVPLHFYQYGSDDSDEVGTQQDSTRRNITETLTDTTISVTQSLEAITMNMTQFVASTSSKMTKDNTKGNKTQSLTATSRNITQSLTATTSNIAVDDDDRKPSDLLFEAIATAHNVTQLLEATAGNKTQSPAATAINIAQSLSATTSNITVDDDDRKPTAVLFEAISTARNVTQLLESTAGNKTQSPAATFSNVTQSLAATTIDVAVDDDDRKPSAVLFEAIATARNITQILESTAGNKTQSLADMASNVAQSLAATTSNATVDDDDRKPSSVLFEATAVNKTQSPAAMASNVAQSLVATTRDIAQSAVVITSDVAQSLAAMASNVAQSSVAASGNTKAELACFSPEIIEEDAVAREMLLEQPPLSPQVIETLLSFFHPIICLQLLTILPFIHRWLQMMRRRENFWKKIAKQTPLLKSSPRELQHVFLLTQMPINLQCII